MTKAQTKQDKTLAPLTINGRDVPLRIKLNRRAKRLILRLDNSGGVVVTSPTRTAHSQALKFAREQQDWIAKQLSSLPQAAPFKAGGTIPFRGQTHRITHRPLTRRGVWIETPDECLPEICISGDLCHLPRRTRDWLKRTAKSDLSAHCLSHAQALDLPPTPISVRDTFTRWGSCSSTGTLSFSWRLILAPPFILDYVAAHETAHRIHMNHGRTFWKIVDKLTPHRMEAEKWLQQRGNELHRVGVT